MRDRISYALSLILVFFSFSIIAATTPESPAGKVFFDAQSAMQQLEADQKNLTNSHVTLPPLVKGIQRLDASKDQAKECVTKADEQLKMLDELLKVTQASDSLQLQQADYKYLQEKKIFYTKQRSECRLFVYRAQALLVSLKDIAQKMNANKLFQRRQLFQMGALPVFSKAFYHIDFKKLYEKSSLNKITLGIAFVCLALILLTFLASLYCRKKLAIWLKHHEFTHQALAGVVAVSARFIVPISIFLVVGIFFENIYPNQTAMLETLSYIGFIYVLSLALCQYLFSPSLMQSPFGLEKTLGQKFYRQLSHLLIWLLIGAIFSTVFSNGLISTQLYVLTHVVFVSILIFLMARVGWLFFETEIMKQSSGFTVNIIKAFLGIILFGLLVIEWMGYQQLCVFMLRGIIITVFLFASAIMVWFLINAIYQILTETKYPVAQKIRHYFGLKPHRQIRELQLIKYTLMLTLLCLLFVGLMKVWGLPTNTIDFLVEKFVNGFKFADLHIIPLRLIIALLCFAFIFLAGRFIAASIANRHKRKSGTDAQSAIASILVYIAFCLALLFSMLIMGVNFTGLAIIAGALSVGIGLGLQSIVNNFVSGLILLIEKPIKTGDRIAVGETEGFVKKIRIRSTQITTLSKEDIIIPNSDLITNQVTNYMFRDSLWRVTCQVGVAYGSDIEKVKQVLLEVAAAHEGVVQTQPNQPSVIFSAFSDSSLTFELWTIITDVNKKHQIASDLNFAIDRAFREHNITIAFPQRDLHIITESTDEQPTNG